jgi:hypothetical protein
MQCWLNMSRWLIRQGKVHTQQFSVVNTVAPRRNVEKCLVFNE